MFDLYTTTQADISPCHVTSGAFIRKLRQKLSDQVGATLRAKARPNCNSCFGRGYEGMMGDQYVPCRCTK